MKTEKQIKGAYIYSSDSLSELKKEFSIPTFGFVLIGLQTSSSCSVLLQLLAFYLPLHFASPVLLHTGMAAQSSSFKVCIHVNT